MSDYPKSLNITKHFLKLIKKVHLRTWIGIFLIAILLPVIILSLYKSQSSQAAWFDDGWTYRMKVPITAHTGAETNKYFSVTVDTSDTTKFQADCGDIRFLNSSGDLLNYYISSGCSSASTIIHVLVPSFPAGASNYYMYYGNPTVANGFSSSDFSAGTGITVGTVGSEEKGTGPILYWSMDEGYGTTTYDSTSNRNNGTLTGAWESEQYCVTGKCIFLSNSSTQGLGTATVSPLSKLTSGSVSIWAKYTGVNRYQDIFNLYRGADTTATGFELNFDNRTSGGVNIKGTASKDGSLKWEFTVASADFNAITETNKWHLYTLVHDGTTPSLYIDGKPINITFTTTTDKTVWFKAFLTDATSKADTLAIGLVVANNTPFNPATAFFDDFKIYPYARSATQLKADYISRGTNEGVSAQFGNTDQKYLSDGLVAYWKFDESSSTASDSSGNGLTLTNNGTTPYTDGKFGNAPTYNGSTRYFSTATTISGVQSVSFWTYPGSTTDNFINLASGVYVSASGGTLSATGFTNPTIYVNGVQTTTIAASVWQYITITTSSSISGSAVNIGRANSTVAVNNSRTDDVRFYNRILSAQEVSKLYNWAPGPIGYWQFDENTGTTLHDASGNGNGATITDTANVGKWTSGQYGSAYDMEGNETSDVMALDNTIDLGTRNTIAYWVYFVNSTNSPVIGGNYSTTEGYMSYRESTTLYSRPGTGVSAASVSYTTAINTWYHIEVVRDNTSIKFYVNGIQAGSTQTLDANPNFTLYSLTNYVTGVTNYPLEGRLDDVRVYNYPRSSQQVIEDMNGGHPAGGSPLGSQIMYWKLDEQNGNTINNSGFGTSTYNGTNSGATWLQNNSCKVNGCLYFDTTTDSVSAGDVAYIDGLTGFTTSFWLNPQTLATNKMIVSKANTTTQRVFQIKTDDTTAAKLKVMISSSAADTSNYCVTASSVLSASTWQHVTVVYDGTATTGNDQRVKVYVNGAPTSCTVTGTIPTSLVSSTTSNFKLGQGDDTTPTALISYIDELKIYTSALTADQVKIEAQYGSTIDFGTGQNETTQITGTAETGPILYLPLDENTGTTAADKSGNGLNGTLTNGPVWSLGKIGEAVFFDGSNDQIQVSHNSLLNVVTGYTVEGWVKPTAGNGSYRDILVKGIDTAGGETSTFYMQITDTNQFEGGHKANTFFRYADSTTTASLNTWYHVTITNNSSNTSVKIYINGKLEATTAYTTDAPLTQSSPLLIGVGNGSNYRPFTGYIDDIKVYNYERTPAQVAYDYNRGAPIGWWKFDEGNGTISNDSSENSYTGTLTGTPSWVDGKFNTGISLNGSSQYSTVTDAANIRFDSATQNFSVFAWVKRAATGSEMDIVSKEDADNDGYRLEFTSGNIVRCSANSTDVDSTATITDTTTWHLVGCSMNRSGTGQIYIDGYPSGTATSISAITMSTTANILIGARSYTTANYFNGTIDGVRLYNYALTLSQIKKLYNEGSSVRFGPTQGTPAP